MFGAVRRLDRQVLVCTVSSSANDCVALIELFADKLDYTEEQQRRRDSYANCSPASA
jgi:hypothetical protein